MFVRYATLGLMFASFWIVPSVASANRSMSRGEIRSLPITERPSRVGHFYGNAVRRAHYRSSGGR